MSFNFNYIHTCSKVRHLSVVQQQRLLKFVEFHPPFSYAGMQKVHLTFIRLWWSAQFYSLTNSPDYPNFTFLTLRARKVFHPQSLQARRALL
jgi:hypothetical protein